MRKTCVLLALVLVAASVAGCGSGARGVFRLFRGAAKSGAATRPVRAAQTLRGATSPALRGAAGAGALRDASIPGRSSFRTFAGKAAGGASETHVTETIHVPHGAIRAAEKALRGNDSDDKPQLQGFPRAARGLPLEGGQPLGPSPAAGPLGPVAPWQPARPKAPLPFGSSLGSPSVKSPPVKSP